MGYLNAFTLTLSLAPLASLLVNAQHADASPSSLQWTPCNITGQTWPMQCTNITVPFDYRDPITKNYTFPIVKAAGNQPVAGSIIFNFGGPGQEAINTLAILARSLNHKTGGEHDLIAFDPRGVSQSLNYSCFNNSTEINTFVDQHPLLLDNAYPNALGRVWLDGKAIAAQCAENAKPYGEYVGTAYVVHDMMHIVDALGGDRKLRFWGFSYGTVLGMTAAAMFPDKMHKLVLDGVVNANEYYHGFNTEEVVDAEWTLNGILTACLAARHSCDLAQMEYDTTRIRHNIGAALDRFREEPMYINGTTVDYSFVVSYLYSYIKYPDDPSGGAATLQQILERNETTIAAVVTSLHESGALLPLVATPGIVGADRILRFNSSEQLKPIAEKFHEASAWFGGVPLSLMSAALQWPFNAKVQFQGNFSVCPAGYPPLFIGNTWDPATPLLSARNMSTGFPGSVVLQHNGYGHTSLRQNSSCTDAATQEYFSTGKLPRPGHICNLDKPLFENRTLH